MKNNSFNRQYKVSAVIPAYNAEKYIQRAVDSILSQTYPADEIIVVDDGSVDKTPDILAEYGNKIIFVRQENAGASIARNTGIMRAAGDWVAFLDADDEWLPSFLELQLKYLKDNPSLIWSYSNYWFVQPDTGKIKIAFASRPLLENNVIPDYLKAHSKHSIRTSATIIKKSVLCESGLFIPEQKWVQDTDIFFRIAYKYPETGYIHTPLARYYNDVPGSLTTRYCFLANELCNLVERHLVLSQKYNRQKELIQCLSEKIPYWINVALQHKNFKEARIMLKRIGRLVPVQKRLKLIIATYIPFLHKTKKVIWGNILKKTKEKRRCFKGIFVAFRNKRKWNASIKLELNFWDSFFRTKGLQWKDKYGLRFDSELQLQKRPLELLPSQKDEVVILDVGAGPLTTLGKKVPGKKITIIAVDPLAEAYDRILKRHQIEPLIQTEKLDAEQLTDRFPENTFDLVCARNSIDHSYNPEQAILQMIKVAKKGCYVLMEHRENEAIKEGYRGLHQWNFSLSENGDFLISSKKATLNFTQKYNAICQIVCELDTTEDWLVTRILKR